MLKKVQPFCYSNTGDQLATPNAIDTCPPPPKAKTRLLTDWVNPFIHHSPVQCPHSKQSFTIISLLSDDWHWECSFCIVETMVDAKSCMLERGARIHGFGPRRVSGTNAQIQYRLVIYCCCDVRRFGQSVRISFLTMKAIILFDSKIGIRCEIAIWRA
jgi:hypothetical protein